MLWKELFIERVASLGRFGRWVGVLLTLAIGGGSFVLAAMMVYSAYFAPDSDLGLAGVSTRSRLVLGGFAGTLLGWLLQWGVGLRAAVSIASERERGTWDALLMSPLKPGRDLAWPSSSAAFMRCAIWPPRCCWPGRWRRWCRP